MSPASQVFERATYRVLAVDAEPAMRQVLAGLLGDSCRMSLAASGEEALSALQKQQVDLLLISADLPAPESCRDIVDNAMRLEPDLAIVVLTASTQPSEARPGLHVMSRELLRSEQGRTQFLLFIDRLGRDVRRKREAGFREERSARRALEAQNFVIGVSAASAKLREQIQRAASCDLNVLLTGETGVGKSMVASSIHHAWSGKERRPFILMEPATLPSTLFESELFGHAQGAFTGATHSQRGAFEAANGGTIFLDEIGEVPALLQAKLLRVVEDKVIKRIGEARTIELDVRIIAATNRPLEEQVEANHFRADLFQRLNELRVHVPPLRERREDIVPLFEHFLGQHTRDRSRACELSEDARRLLESYHWPGNIRELRTLARRIAHDPLPEVLTADMLGLQFPARRNDRSDLSLDARIEAFGRELYLEVLSKHRFQLRETARALGMPYATLRSRLKALGLLHVISERRAQRTAS